jgi:AAA15 family ATPase/GTPase
LLFSSIYNKYRIDYFVNIVEELEQNLYPSSQKSLLYSLLKFVNKNENNQLILTTHSPYIINYLTLSIKAKKVLTRIKEIKYKESKLNKIIPIKSCIDGRQSIIYEISDDGSIAELKNYDNLPSDNNFLNNFLEKTNDDFDKLDAYS